MSPEEGTARASPEGGLDLVLVWHMHQPEYRGADGEFRLPWVYLHALKDYSDMAAHLEREPRARAVVNFVPILVEQLEDYADQFRQKRWRDPLLRLLARPDDAPFPAADRARVLDQCFHANHHQMVAPFPAYRRLHELFRAVEAQGPEAAAYLSQQYLFDLLTWYHLTWTGESVRRDSLLVAELMAAGSGYTHAQRLALLELIGEVVCGILPRYRRLEAEGRIEVSTTPYFHPIGPLLIDFGAAREARPDCPLPEAEVYPGGASRVAWHVARAMEAHARWFGRPPSGVWPAEGGVSDAFLHEAGRAGLAWIATGEQVLAHSLAKAGRATGERERWLYRPYCVSQQAADVACFFRDDRLSDLIGFEYRKWDGGHAAGHFVGELEAIAARATNGERPLVSVILDGENAWEHYPYNGYYFLSALYEMLAGHSSIRMHTYRDWLAGREPRAVAEPLPGLTAGSWVYGDFTTWIGSHDKNAAWDLLVSAKQAFDLVIDRLDPAAREAAWRQLAVCESSDWFWWFGDYNPAHSVASFDALYRANLADLYRRLRLAAPASLDTPISRGSAAASDDGAMRRAS